MGMWNQHRPKVMACCCCLSGLLLLIVASVVFSEALSDEVQLWYNVPLVQGQARPDAWVSTSATGEPTSVQVGGYGADAAWVSYDVPQRFFTGGFLYSTFLFRTNGSDIYSNDAFVDLKMDGYFDASSRADTSGANTYAALSAGGASRLLAAEAEAAAAAAAAAEAEAQRGGADADADADADAAGVPRRHLGRRLLKGSSGGASGGGYSSGPSYRSRTGSYSYWGVGAGVGYRYGRRSSQPVVESLVIVSVFSRAPIVGQRSSTSAMSQDTSGGAFDATSGCGSEAGCEYVLRAPMLKDQITKADFTTPDPVSETGSFKLSVRALMNYSLAAPQSYTAASAGAVPTTTQEYPKLFVVFSTAETNGGQLTGYVLIPISCVILLFGTACALMFNWSFCPDTSVRGGRGGGVTKPASHPAASATAARAAGVEPVGFSATNPMSGGSEAPVHSIITMPMPQASGYAFSDINGSWESTAISHPNPTSLGSIDLSSNDVASISGLSNFPALQNLILNNNDVRTLTGVHQCPSLCAIEIDSNQLHTLHGLMGLPNLRWFRAADNDINTLAGANGLTSCTYVCLASNELKSLDGIVNFPALTHLDVSSNALTSIVGLDVLALLMGVDLHDNDLDAAAVPSVLALARLPKLVVVDLRGNNFSAVDKQRIRDTFAERAPGCRLLI